jgi:hypothetical protein
MSGPARKNLSAAVAKGSADVATLRALALAQVAAMPPKRQKSTPRSRRRPEQAARWYAPEAPYS